MNPHDPASETDFDKFASSYDEDLRRGLSVSGESKEYFAEQRVRWTQKRLDALGFPGGRVLDFGCGTGGSVPYLRALVGYTELVGVDPSGASLDRARREHVYDDVDFALASEMRERGPFDLGYANGVFHHITASERPAVLAELFSALRPGGLFAMWENNPLNPGTRWVMSRVAFDRDAEPFSARVAKRMFSEAGFEVVLADHLFIFPGVLRGLRPLEPKLAGLPLGAQYLVLVRRPEVSG